MDSPNQAQLSNAAHVHGSGSPVPAFPPLPRGSYKDDPGRREQSNMDLLDDPKDNSTELDLPYLLPVAWAAVIARYTDSDEALFGIAYRGRKTDMGDQAISPFRLGVSPTDTLSDAMASAARYDGEMRQYEHIGLHSFSNLNPTNMVLCKFRTLLVIGDKLHGKRAEVIQEQYPLSMYACGTSIQACFDSLLLSPDVLRTLLFQLADFLQAAIERPNSTILDVQTVGKKGLAQMQNWHTSHDMYIHELINMKLLNHPSAPAVSAWDGELTYGQLDRWASSLSRHIIGEAGVQPGQFVGLLVSKSATTVVALLSVIKSGAAAVFLPPSLPTARLQTMCRIARVQLILTTTNHRGKAEELGVPVIQINAQPPPTEEIKLYESTVRSGPLYAVFTSGSMGEPKGVQVDRGSFGPGIANFCEQTRLGPDSRIFQSVSYAFVVSIFEQLAALAIGACICIPSEEQLQNDMEATLAQCKADWAAMTPTVARTLSPSLLPALKTVLLVGEPATAADIKQWKQSTTPYSLYGQTELASTVFVRRHESIRDAGNIGFPVTGKCWVVDQTNYHRLCAAGVEGELLIESTAMGTCYLGNHEQTAATFVEQRPAWNPDVDGFQTRWALTGDLVRYNCLDGSIQIAGRKGTRTKIRGQRVELGEIESSLRVSLPSAQQMIAEVVTPAVGDGSGRSDAVLIAFACADSQTPASDLELEILSTAESRANNRKALTALRQLLPEYMIPSVILDLRYVPRTVSGKINRKALRDWAAEQSVYDILKTEESAPFRAAETQKERVLQSLCEKILHIPSSKIGLDDNFFDIGGNSLTARQVVSASRSRGFHITVSDVFNQPTLAAMARRYVKRDGPVSSAANVDEDIFASFKGELLQELPSWLDAGNLQDAFPTLEMQTHLVKSDVFDYFPVKINGAVSAEQLRRSCQILVDAHPALRSIHIPFKGQIAQVVLRKATINWVEVTAPSDADLMTWTRSWVIEDRQHPPPMTQPTTCFTLIHHGSDESAFIVRLSHAHYDGACYGPLFEQIGAIYSDPELAPHAGSDFPGYRRACARLRTSQAFEHWKDILADSEVT
ncbi:hypothetical protein N7522_002871 [Penicillium canescens]|nr:hypothetical protein N7522_002871 [Penicillium canescens]